LKILVIGYGSIGKRHVGNILRHTDFDVIVCTKISKQSKNNRCKFFHTIEESLREKPDAAIICSYTSRHVEDSIRLANKGIHLLIEKPLSNSLKNTKHLLRIIHKKNLITLMGCNLRFHPCIIKMKELISKKQIGKILSIKVEHGSYLPYWHPNEKYQHGYAARQDLGGGVLLTSIHEIDYLYWFFGSCKEVFSITDKISKLKTSADDLSSILLRFQNNIVAEIHLDFFQRPLARSCKIIGENGTLSWNFDENIVNLYDIKKNKWIKKFILKNYDYNDMYVNELKYFINCINSKKQTFNDIHEGVEIIKIALAAKHSSKRKKMVLIN